MLTFLPLNSARWPIVLSDRRGRDATRKQRSGGTAPCVATLHAIQQHRRFAMTGNSALILALVCGLGRRGIRLLGPQLDSFPGRRQRPHAGNRSGHPDRRRRLPGAPVQDHRHRRRRAGHPDRRLPRRPDRHRLRHRRGALGRLRLHRHERLGARQRAHRAGRHPRHRPGAGRRLPRRRHHRHAGGGPGPAGRDGLLLVPGRQRQPERRTATWPSCSTR